MTDQESAHEVLMDLYKAVQEPAPREVALRLNTLDKHEEGDLGNLSTKSVYNVLKGAHKPTNSVVKGFIRGCLQVDTKRGRNHVLSDDRATFKYWWDRYTTARDRAIELALPDDEPFDGTSAPPSELLNSRNEVVSFRGRDRELADLTRWRDAPGRLAVRWLHGPGGQGKTRLAEKFADISEPEWSVVRRDQSRTDPLPEKGRGGRNLLLVVDYADRLPVPVLASFLRDPALGAALDSRVLLVGRSRQPLSWVRTELQGATVDEMALAPLADTLNERLDAFHHACDCFAKALRLVDVADLRPPVPLDRPDMGSALSLHMAALVAVDAHARGETVDGFAEPGRLSRYLLEREERHWHEWIERSRTFTTTPEIMRHAVFTACLTGRLSYSEAKAAVAGFTTGLSPDTVLADHARCYPPETPVTTEVARLEPLYPDHLAEDFIALCMPGHGGDAPGWSLDRVRELLARNPDGSWPSYIDRAITFLAAASAPGRNPHVAPHLAANLRENPAVAFAAGNAALAAITHLDDDTLEAVMAEAPAPGDSLVDIGIYTVMRNAQSRHPDVEPTGDYLRDLSDFAFCAGMHDNAVAHLRDAVHMLRTDPSPDAQRSLASALGELSFKLTVVGDDAGSAEAAADASRVRQKLAAAGSTEPDYESVYDDLLKKALTALTAGQHDAALVLSQQILDSVGDFPEDERPGAAGVASLARGSALLGLQRYVDAALVLEDAIRLIESLQDDSRTMRTMLENAHLQLRMCYVELDDANKVKEHEAKFSQYAQGGGLELRDMGASSPLMILAQVENLMAEERLDDAVAMVRESLDLDQFRSNSSNAGTMFALVECVAASLVDVGRWNEARPLLALAVANAHSMAMAMPTTVLTLAAEFFDKFADMLAGRSEDRGDVWNLRIDALEFARVAADRTPSAQSRLVRILEGLVVCVVKVDGLADGVTPLRALVDVLGLVKDRADLIEIIPGLIGRLMTVENQEISAADRMFMLNQAMDICRQWASYFAENHDEGGVGAWVHLVAETAIALLIRGEHADAMGLADQAEAALNTTSPPEVRAVVLAAVAASLHETGGDIDRALSASEESLDLYLSISEPGQAQADQEVEQAARLYAVMLDRAGRSQEAEQVRALHSLD
ncbi:hypothetical protein [Amycolatopsis sp. NBRC 101858]|uniref:hypothetical protein n=1 Tax=Amycolatopsis sp. NBRC 101858 TaxID=3032200 RepID=UPI002552A613|nr:hypothetical protein [Amycolatopsis sp. NBRC 101858]